MNKVINQFRRLYDDKGTNDHDFSEQEARLREAQAHLKRATESLMRSSEMLNTAALGSMPVTKH